MKCGAHDDRDLALAAIHDVALRRGLSRLQLAVFLDGPGGDDRLPLRR